MFNKEYKKLVSIVSRFSVIAIVATLVGVVSATSSSAHVSTQLYGSSAVAGGGAVVWVRVPHSKPGFNTVKIEVRIPYELGIVKPEHISGWSESTELSADGKNTTLVTWEGGSLPDSSFQDFGMKLTLPDKPGEKVYFPTVQTLSDGSLEQWIDIPDSMNPNPAKPAPSLLLNAPAGSVNQGVSELEKYITFINNLYYQAKADTKKMKIVVEGDAPSRFRYKSFTVKTSGEMPIIVKSGKFNSNGDFIATIPMMGGSGKSSYHIMPGDELAIFSGKLTIAKIKVA